MALAFDRWQLVLTAVDQGGNESHPKFELVADNTETIADMETVAGTIVTRFLAVSDCVVTAYHLGVVYTDDAVAYGTGEAENVALIVADIADEVNKTANIRIPAPKATIFKGSAGKDWNTVDTADAAIQAYLSTFEAGGFASVSDGEFIKDSATSGNWYGKRIHRGSRVG